MHVCIHFQHFSPPIPLFFLFQSNQGDANEKYIIQLSPMDGITELELHSILAIHEKNVPMTLIWDAIVSMETFSTLLYQHEATSWSKKLLTSFPFEYKPKSSPSSPSSSQSVSIQSVLHSLQRESITISQSTKENENNKNYNYKTQRPTLSSQSAVMKSRRQQFARMHGSDISKHHRQVTLISAHQLSNGCYNHGQCTIAFLEAMRNNQHQTKSYTLAALLLCIASLCNMQPQLTSSMQLNMYSTLHIVPPNIAPKCTKRALLIGINYLSLSDVIHPLQDSHAHVEQMKQYLFKVEGFLDQHCIKLMDDNKHEEPTTDNILDAFARLARQTNPGDVVVFYFSGYSARDLDMIFSE